MSRKNSTRKKPLHGQPGAPSRVTSAISVQELQTRWDSLHLQTQTKVHLQNILKVEGLDLALAATIALTLEQKREEQRVARSLWDWMIEELRLLLLEEGCVHVIDSGRLIADAILTWTLMRGPVLLIRLALPLIALGVLLLSCFLSCFLMRVHRRQHRGVGQKH